MLILTKTTNRIFKIIITLFIVNIFIDAIGSVSNYEDQFDNSNYNDNQNYPNPHGHHLYKRDIQDGAEESQHNHQQPQQRQQQQSNLDQHTSSIPLSGREDQLIIDAYASNGYSIAVNSLDIEVKTHIKRQILNTLGIENEPSNLANIDNSGALYIQSLYRKFNVKVKGSFVVNPNDATVKLLTHNSTGGLVYSRMVDVLSFGTQEAINKSDTIVSCTNQEISNTNRASMEFGMSPSISRILGPNTPVIAAQLRVFRNYSGSQHLDPFALSVFANGIVAESFTQIPHAHDGWVTLNVTSAVREWAKNRKRDGGPKELRLSLIVSSGAGSHVSSYGIFNSASLSKEFHPFLVIFMLTKDIPTKPVELSGSTESQLLSYLDELRETDQAYSSDQRHRRSLKQQPNKAKEKPYRNQTRTPIRNPFHEKFCNKHVWHVDFKQLNWASWIIAPDGFDASYCFGKCPFPLPPNLNSTNHAIVQYLAHLIYKDIPEPCCAPTKVQPISVLYYDDYSNVVLKEYRNMIIQSCGCQ